MKRNYAAFTFGFGVLVLGVFLLFFGRPYVYDYTNKDLFLPFAILLITIGCTWTQGNDLSKLNQQKIAAEMHEFQPPEMTTPQHSFMTGTYAGYNLPSPI
ncbi:hypothetical protein SprV_0200762200 [Sparganum proliferum]